MIDKDYCLDNPDIRNFSYSEIAWANINLPTSYIIDDIADYQNQGLEKVTQYMCTAFATTHWVNILNNIENLWEEDYVAKDFWLKMVDLWRLNTESGAYIIDAPKTAKELWRIAWYFQVYTIEDLKKAIYEGHPVVTWSNKLAWDKVCYAKENYGHCILIIGYNEKWFIIKNSYGKNKYNNWTNLLPYNLFDKLMYTKLALVDNPNTILLYKQKLMAEITNGIALIAKEKWVWNWEKPTENITNQDCAAMIYKQREYLENKLNYIENLLNTVISLNNLKK